MLRKRHTTRVEVINRREIVVPSGCLGLLWNAYLGVFCVSAHVARSLTAMRLEERIGWLLVRTLIAVHGISAAFVAQV